MRKPRTYPTKEAVCERCGKDFMSKLVQKDINKWTKFCSRKCAIKGSSWRGFNV